MTTPFDPRMSAVERVLHDRGLHAPPAGLRRRVLTAVDETLQKKVPATKYGEAAQRNPLECADLVAGTFVMITALSLLIVATLSSEATSHQVSAATDRPLLSFAQRAEAAGLTLDVEPPLAMRLADRQPDHVAIPLQRDIPGPLDSRSFLKGDI